MRASSNEEKPPLIRERRKSLSCIPLVDTLELPTCLGAWKFIYTAHNVSIYPLDLVPECR